MSRRLVTCQRDFAHGTELSLQAAASLVNSAGPPDTLTSQAEYEVSGLVDLLRLLDEHGSVDG
jgi:hypothetical protein